MLNFTSEGIPIVFLHGHSYDRTIWQKLGILDLLISKKVPFLALDMPYGAISECKPKTQDPQTNVTVANEAIQYLFGLTAPVIVGASLGGHIALRYAQQHPVKGLLLVAPAFVFEDAKLTSAYSRFDFPVRIIWGSEDNIILGEDMRTLSDILPNSKLVTYNGATHSAYKDQPDRFKRDLLELYALAE
jgi:pimeloyl-ACP methyl ester carboxylesterase